MWEEEGRNFKEGNGGHEEGRCAFFAVGSDSFPPLFPPNSFPGATEIGTHHH